MLGAVTVPQGKNGWGKAKQAPEPVRPRGRGGSVGLNLWCGHQCAEQSERSSGRSICELPTMCGIAGTAPEPSCFSLKVTNPKAKTYTVTWRSWVKLLSPPVKAESVRTRSRGSNGKEIYVGGVQTELGRLCCVGGFCLRVLLPPTLHQATDACFR